MIPARYTPVDEYARQTNEGTTDMVIATSIAIACVSEILKALPKDMTFPGYGYARFNNPDIRYWKEVKQELEKL